MLLRRLFIALAFLAAAQIMSAQSLDDLRWKNRVLIIYAPAGSDEKLARQRDLLWKQTSELRERDVTEITLRDKAERPEITRRFGLKEFTVLLLGKDGGEKLRSAEPVQPEALFRLIDSMPMRQEEARRQR